MKCPSCSQASLVETMTKGGVLVDVCKTCKGVWLDRGEVFFFSRKPRELERLLASETQQRAAVDPPVPSVPHQPGRVAVPAARPAGRPLPALRGILVRRGRAPKGDGDRSPRIPARDRRRSARTPSTIPWRPRLTIRSNRVVTSGRISGSRT